MKNLKRVLNKKRSQSLRSHIEPLENRRLLSAAIAVINPLLVFNAVQKSSVSSTETLTIQNTGSSPLTLGSGAFKLVADPGVSTNDTARFSILNLSSAPASLASGQAFGLNINYNANAIGINSALIDIATNDPAIPTAVVHLRGIGTKGLGGSNQPSLATILRAYNIPTIVGEGHNDANAASDSIYPNPPDSSSQEVALQRLVKAGAGPVTINVLAAFTASGYSKSYELGTYTPGNTSSLSELFYTPASENQTTYVHPQGATSFDPGINSFGFYFVSNVQVKGRIGYSEDALNTWDTTNSRKIRFFPMENPDGSVVPNTYIMTSTEWNAPIGYDFTNIVAVVSNVKAAVDAPDGPVLGLQNTNPLPGTNRMIFNTIQKQNTSLGDQFHATGVLDVNNTGDKPLIVSSYSLSTGWALVSPPAFPFTVQPGATTPLTIKFTQSSVPSHSYNETNDIYYPSGGAAMTGSITLTSNDPAHASESVPLAGYFQSQSENSQEPDLQTMVNLLAGWTTNISPTQMNDLKETTATSGSPTYYGEEVVSPYWAAADTSVGVTMQQIAAFHTEGNTTNTAWYPQGKSGSSVKLYNTALDDGQTFFPYAYGTTTPATATFYPTTPFGFKVDNTYTDDSLNKNTPGAGHHFRFYPVRDTSGNMVPNTYLMTMDYTNSPENFDFQDNVWIVSNVHPVTTMTGFASPQTTAAPVTPINLHAAGQQGGVLLEWSPVLGASVGSYDVYRCTSVNGTYTLLTNTGATAYYDSTAPGGVTEYYHLTAVATSGGTQSIAAGASAAAIGTSPAAPAAPTNLQATGITNAVSLSWSAVSDPTLAGYKVYSSTSASGPFTLLTALPIGSTSYTDSSAPVGSVEYYHVTAVDSASGLESTAASASGTAIAAVTGLQSVDVGASPAGSTTVITAGKDFNVTAGGPGVAGTVDGFRYIYQAQTGDFDVSVQVQSLTVAGNFSTAGILARSTLATNSPDVYMSASPVNYRFKERATVGGVNNIVTGGSIAFPNVWVRLSRIGNLFTGYSSTDGLHWTTFSTISLALPATIDLGLAVASNATNLTTTAQLRGYGNTTVVTTPTPPPAPTGFTASGAVDAVNLNWSAVQDSTLKGYDVYSSTSSTGTYTLLTSSPISATSYTDSSAQPGVTMFYKVTSVDASSGLESTAATASATATATAPPAAPTNLTATGVVDAINLNWTASTDPTLKGYNVYNSASSTGTFTLLTTSPVTATSFTDSSVTAGVMMYYKVTAIDSTTGLESTAATASATAIASVTALTSVDIGASPSGSTTTVTPGSAYNVTAGGPGVTGNPDGFRYLYAQQTGNFDVKVQVTSLTVAGNYSTAGLMARSTLDAGSANVYMSASPVNYRFKDRPTANAATAISTVGNTSYPNVWLRLTRIGNVFTGYYGTNGTTWTQMSSVTVALPATVYLGLAVASNVATTTTTASLQNYGNT